MPHLIHIRRILTGASSSAPSNAITINGQPITIGGQYVTIGS